MEFRSRIDKDQPLSQLHSVCACLFVPHVCRNWRKQNQAQLKHMYVFSLDGVHFKWCKVGYFIFLVNHLFFSECLSDSFVFYHLVFSGNFHHFYILCVCRWCCVPCDSVGFKKVKVEK